jgi:hypothetical protein
LEDLYDSFTKYGGLARNRLSISREEVEEEIHTAVRNCTDLEKLLETSWNFLDLLVFRTVGVVKAESLSHTSANCFSTRGTVNSGTAWEVPLKPSSRPTSLLGDGGSVSVSLWHIKRIEYFGRLPNSGFMKKLELRYQSTSSTVRIGSLVKKGPISVVFFQFPICKNHAVNPHSLSNLRIKGTQAVADLGVPVENQPNFENRKYDYL